MLKEAQEEDDKTGLSRCYNIMSQIYTIKRFDSMAFEWRLKEIELTEKITRSKTYNISQTYAQIANYYINQKKQKEALAAVEKSHCDCLNFLYATNICQVGIRKLLQQVRRLSSCRKITEGVSGSI